jgi:hypothetical protein
MALLTDAEEKYWEALRILEERGGWGMAVPLNNLALLAFYRGDWARADELFGSALDAADNEEISLRIRCNRARLTAQEDPRSTVLELRELVPGRNAMNRALRSFVSFNLARTFVEAGCFREALLEAKSPPPWLGKDRDLAVAAWAKLRLRAYRGMGVKSVPEVNLLGKAKVLEETPKLQSWMYRDLWPVGEAIFD